jgi:hypothetical protein
MKNAKASEYIHTEAIPPILDLNYCVLLSLMYGLKVTPN